MPEAVAGPGDDQRAGAERGVEQRERVRLGQPGQRGHADRVEVVAGHREPAQHRGGGVVEVEETLGDRVPDRRRDSRVAAAADAAGQLQGEERVALRHPDDPGDHAGCGVDRAPASTSAATSSWSSGPRSIREQRPARSRPATPRVRAAARRSGRKARAPRNGSPPPARARCTQASTVASSARCASSTTSSTPVTSRQAAISRRTAPITMCRVSPPSCGGAVGQRVSAASVERAGAAARRAGRGRG